MRIIAITLLALAASTCLSVSPAQEGINKPTQSDHEPQKSDGAVEITFNDLKFEIANDAKFDRKMIGEKLANLDGKPVKIRGIILPASVYQRDGIKLFILTYKSWEHCVSPLTSLIDSVRVEMAENTSTSFTTQPVVVEGEFSIKEWAVINGRPAAVYHIKAISVTPQQADPAKK